jgi:glutathione S-transferase
MKGVPKLYVIPGSHPCRAAMLMLERKGLSWRTVELPGGLQPVLMRLLGFPGRTVPALKLDGVRVQTNRRIARFLDELVPDPPLLRCERREEIEAAERLADEVLQPLARRLVLAAARRDLAEIDGRGETEWLGPILAYTDRRRARVVRLACRYFGVTDETEALDLAALPGVLDEVDAWAAIGVIGGPEPNAADFQIAPSMGLLASRLDLREEIHARPSWEPAERLLALGSRRADEPPAASPAYMRRVGSSE